MDKRRQAFAVLKAQSGDREALDALFRSIQEMLFRSIRGVMGNTGSAEDVLQDVFVILQKSLVHLRDPALFAPWAYRIAIREAVRHTRTSSKTLWSRDGVDADDLADPAPLNPLESVELAELHQLVSTVPLASRSVLVLHYLEDLSLTEVADILSIPIGTVKSRLAYGLQSLRNTLNSKNKIEQR